jgi:protein involved in polysaccharide export with SLBB domain
MMSRVLAVLLLGDAVGAAGSAAQPRPSSFRLGDRVWIHVEGESQLSDTFTVGPGLALTLPMVGQVGLEGVPRSGVEAHLTRELGRFLRNPVVRARALIRVAVAGEVAKPGFYAVATDVVLADAIMLAGGATPDARLDELRVERGDRRLWKPDALQRAIAEGQTLDDLGLEAGDRIVVPRRGGGVTSMLPLLLAVPAAIYALREILR